MTYFGFLAQFLLIPIAFLGLLALWDRRRGVTRPTDFRALSAWKGIALLVGVALIYTTPWDNYLVATRVWWYDPALVTGITFGWVPLEEYTFFVLQPILTGLWLLFLMRLLPKANAVHQPSRFRPIAVLSTGAVWIAAALALAARWEPGTYLALELAWALPPIMLQLAVGGDILWQHRKLILLGIGPTTLYLAAADVLAIGGGTWTISPTQSLGLLIGGVLPVEELLFFLLTNTLVVFGLTLALSAEVHARLRSFIGVVTRRDQPHPTL